MSRFMLTSALMLGSVFLAGGSARADSHRWFGSYDSLADAEAVGQGELDNGGADAYGADYYEEDPTGGDGGEGYYIVVHYPDTPAGPRPPVAGSPTPPSRAPDDDRGPYGSQQDAEEAGQAWVDNGSCEAYQVHAEDADHWYVRLWNKE